VLPDTTHLLYFCSFDDDPTDGQPAERMLIAQQPVTKTDFDPGAYYTPPVPVETICWAQAVDANGNRGRLITTCTSYQLCPSEDYTMTAPTIISVTTQSGGDYGWTARLQWDIEDDLPR